MSSNSSMVTQHSCEKHGCKVSLGQGPPLLYIPPLLYSALSCSALTCSAPYQSTLLCSGEMSSAAQLQPEQHRFQSSLFKPEGSCLIYREDHGPGLLLAHFLQMRTPNPHRVIGPRSTLLIGQNGASDIGQ